LIEKPHPVSFAFELLSASSSEVFAHFSRAVRKRTNVTFLSIREVRLVSSSSTWFPEEIKSLLEVGFEYVCRKDNLIFLKKRK